MKTNNPITILRRFDFKRDAIDSIYYMGYSKNINKTLLPEWYITYN